MSLPQNGPAHVPSTSPLTPASMDGEAQPKLQDAENHNSFQAVNKPLGDDANNKACIMLSFAQKRGELSHDDPKSSASKPHFPL